MKRTLVSLFVFCLACNKELRQPDVPVPPPKAVDALPAGHPPVTGAAAGEGGSIAGRMEVSPAVASRIKAGDTIFLMARSATTGTMVAVAKLAAPEAFPLNFSLNGQNAMLPGGSLSGPVKLSARVDKDGDAMSKNPGDVTGEVTTPVPVPASDVVITLDQVL